MEQGRDIDDPEVLADLAAQNNVMSRAEALSFIESDELAKKVEDMSTAAHAKGVTGVPVVIIDGKLAVSGSQSCDIYVQIFKKLATCHCAHCAMTSPRHAGFVECSV